MSIREQCAQIIYRISWGLDEHHTELIGKSFTKDAVMSIQIGKESSSLVGPLEGREAIQALHVDALAEQTDQRRHQITNLWVESESDDEAIVVSNLTLLSIKGSKISVLSSGWYRDALIHSESGWQIKERYLYLDLPY